MTLRTLSALSLSLGIATILAPAPAVAQEEAVIEMHLISAQGVGKVIGKITAKDTANGFLALKFAMAIDIPP
ncbi:MAG: hypothetical protein ACREIB_08310, partial [Pseudomonadota bacterium]